MRVGLLVAVGVAVLMAGCGGGRPTGSTVPVPSGAPVSGQATVPVVAPLPAVIPVKVTYQLSALQPVIDSLFPLRDSLTTARCASLAGAVCHQYVYRREPMVMRAEQGTLAIETSLAYRARVGVVGANGLAGCGYAPETPRRAELSMRTSIYWRKDWRIGARGTQLAATLRDPCQVTALGLNATPSMQRLIDRQLAGFAAAADTMIPVVADFRPLADSLWKSFLEPTMLDTTGTLWLLVEPTGVQVTPFVGVGPSIQTTMVLYAQPRVVAGGKPVARMRALPVLTLGNAPPGFSVPVTVELPFAELEKQASATLRLETQRDAVKIDTVVFGARGDTTVVQVGVSGMLGGRLELVSRPLWDGAAQELVLEDLTWNLESRGKLSRVTSTLAAPLIGRAIKRATTGGRISLRSQLDSVRRELLVTLNGPMAPGVVMGTSVDPVQVLGVAMTPRAFVVKALFTGQSGVWVR